MEVLANRLNTSTKGDTSQTQQQLAEDATVSDVAQSIVNKALQTIQHGIDEGGKGRKQTTYLCSSGYCEPDVFVPAQIVVVGGTAPSLGP